MGGFFSRILRKMLGKQQLRVLLLGLDSAGKTTILYQMIGKPAETVPTIGFNVETVQWGPLQFVVWDVSGQERLRSFWRHYYRGTSGIVFVVDASDQERHPIVRKELHAVLKEEELKHACLLVIANKMDLPNAVSPEDLTRALGLETLSPRTWFIQPCVASKNQGLKEGLTWLAQTMKPPG